MIEADKTIVRRLVDEVSNSGHLEVIDELYAPELAGAARQWIAPFRASFPDVHMELVELIGEGDKSERTYPADAGTGPDAPTRCGWTSPRWPDTRVMRPSWTVTG